MVENVMGSDMENPCKTLWLEERVKELEAKVAAYKDQNNRLFRKLREAWPDDMRLSCESTTEKAELTLEEITLETDELGIWLLVGDQQAGHVSWYEITKRIQQQLLQEKFMLALAKLDEEDGLL
jgi:hypothetical protein